MTILHRYIAKTIILTSIVVILVVVGLSFFVNLLAELRDVGTGDYTFVHALINVLLRLPHDVYQFFPMLVLLGGVIGLGILSSHHELLVMRTSGYSLFHIMRAVVVGVLLLIVSASFIGEWIAPQLVFMANKHKESAENGGQAVSTANGVWIHEGNSFVHIAQVFGPHHLEGVKRYEFDSQHRLLAAYYAKSLDFSKGHWQLHDLAKTIFKKEHTQSQQFVTATWDLNLNPSLLNVGMVEPEELSLKNLLDYSRHLVKNGLQAGRFQFEFWKRICQPIATLVMILLVIPFVFAAPRSLTLGWRILFSVILGFVFYILNALLGQLSIVFQISPPFAAIFPTLLFASIGYFFIWRLLRIYRK